MYRASAVSDILLTLPKFQTGDLTMTTTYMGERFLIRKPELATGYTYLHQI